MNTPAHITFRHLPSSETLSEYIREQVQWLETHESRIQSCHVVVEPVSGNTNQMLNQLAKRCRVRVEVHVPGATLVSDRTPPAGGGHDDPFLAVRQAFETLRRQLDTRHDKRSHPRAEGRGSRNRIGGRARTTKNDIAESSH